MIFIPLLSANISSGTFSENVARKRQEANPKAIKQVAKIFVMTSFRTFRMDDNGISIRTIPNKQSHNGRRIRNKVKIDADRLCGTKITV